MRKIRCSLVLYIQPLFLLRIAYHLFCYVVHTKKARPKREKRKTRSKVLKLLK